MNRQERRRHDALVRQEVSRRKHLPVVNRRCGECTACCTILAVADTLGKGAYEKCKHDSGRCNIYETKPEPCSTFRCLWHVGGLETDQRPDMFGVMIDVSGPGQLGPVPVIWELFEGAAESPGVQALIEKWNSVQQPVIVAYKDRRRIIGAKEDVQIDLA